MEEVSMERKSYQAEMIVKKLCKVGDGSILRNLCLLIATHIFNNIPWVMIIYILVFQKA